MSQSIAKLALVVRDYDEAVAWFSRCLGFELAEDMDMGGGKRWVVMQPPGGPSEVQGAALLLAKAVGPQQEAAIGKQSGGRVFLFLETDNFDRDHARMTREGVRFMEAPRREPYGTVAVFEDLCGNRWDLIEPAPQARK
jgi:catechol 2,3-dioxygenase-like lactoylglutathione lyase family enzyme